MYNTPKQLNQLLTIIAYSISLQLGIARFIACGLLVLNGESNSRSSITVYVAACWVCLYLSHELRTKACWFVLENWSDSHARCACTKRLDETKTSETRDETPRRFGPRPRRDPRRTGPRPRCWALCPRQDRDETLVRLETVSRPRRRDRDHIPVNRYD